MKHLFKCLLVSTLLPITVPSFASDVLVTVGEFRGQGTLRKRGNECLVITPRHVTEEHAINGITLLLSDRTTASAEMVEEYELDVAVLRPEPGRITRCKDQPFSEEKIKSLLKQHDRGTLRMVNTSGSAALVPVNIVAYDTFKSIQITPGSDDISITQGFSGSLLYINRRPVGMLTTVENGIGHVIQSTTLNAAIDPYFLAIDEASTLHLNISKSSRFLAVPVKSLAKSALFQLATPGDANFQLSLITDRREIPSDTDKLVEYTTQVTGTNKVGDTLLDKTLTTLGNSFISTDKADENAQAQMQLLIEELDPFSYFE